MSEMVERIAKAIYDLDPFIEDGEYVDGFMVSPGGPLSWEQARARDSEFAPEYMLPITRYAMDAARAALRAQMVPTWQMVRSPWRRSVLVEEPSQSPAADPLEDTACEVWQAMIDEALK
jgi:hypothetical protein